VNLAGLADYLCRAYPRCARNLVNSVRVVPQCGRASAPSPRVLHPLYAIVGFLYIAEEDMPGRRTGSIPTHGRIRCGAFFVAAGLTTGLRSTAHHARHCFCWRKFCYPLFCWHKISLAENIRIETWFRIGLFICSGYVYVDHRALNGRISVSAVCVRTVAVLLQPCVSLPVP
jgi:hypothetical protein